MQNFLSYGDGESAVKITAQNEKIVHLLNTVKKVSNNQKIEIQQLAETCISLQEDCDQKLSAITLEYKKELNTHLIRRQLNQHLKNT